MKMSGARLNSLNGVLILLVYILTPLFLITFISPLILLRTLIKICKWTLGTNLGNMVSPLGNLFGVDNLYESPTGTLVLGSVFEGVVTKDVITRLITEKWLNKMDSSGNLFYPELRQGLTQWMGYTFWENDKNFNVLNHVRNINVFSETKQIIKIKRDEVRHLFANLINSPFLKRRSPWEIVIVPNYKCDESDQKDTKTLVLLKVHHSLIDGFSMLNLGENVLEEVSVSKRYNDVPNVQFSFLFKLWAVLRIPYFIVRHVIKTFSSTKEDKSRREVAQFNFDKVPLQNLKKLKKKYDVSLSSLLLAGFVSGIRQVYGESMDYEPECVVPIPIPGHPKKLRNHMSFATISLPINEPCPIKRLLVLNKRLNEAKKSPDVLSTFYLLRCIGSLPSLFVKLFVQINRIPFLLTNFPALSTPCSIEGNRCTEIFFNGGLLQGHLDAICSCIGYVDSVHVTFSMNETFMGSLVKMDEFTRAVLGELEMLARENY